MLLCGGRDLEVQRVMLPNADRQTAEEQQQRAEAEQSSTGATAASVLSGWPPLGVAVARRVLDHAMVQVGRHNSSAKTPCAGLPSLRLRSIAKR